MSKEISFEDLGFVTEVNVSYSSDWREDLVMSEIDETVKRAMQEHLPGFEPAASGGGFGLRDIQFNKALTLSHGSIDCADHVAMDKVARDVSATHPGLTVWVTQDVWATNADDALTQVLYDLFESRLATFNTCFRDGKAYQIVRTAA